MQRSSQLPSEHHGRSGFLRLDPNPRRKYERVRSRLDRQVPVHRPHHPTLRKPSHHPLRHKHGILRRDLGKDGGQGGRGRGRNPLPLRDGARRPHHRPADSLEHQQSGDRYRRFPPLPRQHSQDGHGPCGQQDIDRQRLEQRLGEQESAEQVIGHHDHGGDRQQRQEYRTEQPRRAEVGPDVNALLPHLRGDRRRMGGQPFGQLGKGQRARVSRRGQIVICLQAVPRAQVGMDGRESQHRHDADQGDHPAPDALTPHRDGQAQPEAEDVRPSHVAAGDQQRNPPPGPAPAIGQIPGQQGDEENGQAFGVEVERHRPPRPRIHHTKRANRPPIAENSRDQQVTVISSESRHSGQPPDAAMRGTSGAGADRPGSGCGVLQRPEAEVADRRAGRRWAERQQLRALGRDAVAG
jgi:hypothetical protein